MTDLVEWLRAQIEAVRSETQESIDLYEQGPYEYVLAECDAKERIIDATQRYLDPHPGLPCTYDEETDPDGTSWISQNHREPCVRHLQGNETNVDPYVLRYLALPYADRPGYLTEWAP